METAVSVEIPAGDVILKGELNIPKGEKAVILFAHGSGSSRLSPRNQRVAAYLRQRGLGTLLFDLLTEQEERTDSQTREYRFNIPLLARRLVSTTQWLTYAFTETEFRLGYFGASTGAGAALIAAAELGDRVGAVVSRGGRPDLAGDFLRSVRAATLLVIGEDDVPVIQLNREALEQLHCVKEMKIVPGASHLFEEPGTLDAVSRLAADWFEAFLKTSG
ncbi:MAG: dienelactone hydrolase family protein [Acidobacteria bacterium]|nr:dienelactone hydrolase family protein [Acidobacteriota bacterium]